MKISVVIPTYNSASTIRQTLESVLRQTTPPDEILVLDDGSSDDTVSILHAFEPRITLMQQENGGVANARNKLCKCASGDLIAFLDHDDLWHPRYLEVQVGVFERYPHAAAFFTDHVNFRGYGNYEWNPTPADSDQIESIGALEFLRRYNRTTGLFASMSYCCVPKRTIAEIGCEPFKLSGVDDSYLCTLLPLCGPVIYVHAPLVAYRVIGEAQSVNRLKMYALWAQVFELLNGRYEKQTSRALKDSFRAAFASRRRSYAKVLMGAAKTAEARQQLWQSIGNSSSLSSISKSLALLLFTYMPAPFQPKWPSSHRKADDIDYKSGSSKVSPVL
jgi:glycosyltransferase involved in cell wall biosynthesis